jgi:NADPH:quinone reductase-like Zn-dependent oxidoreductase
MDFLRVIESSTDGRGVDLVLDPVGSSYLEKNLKLLKENGRLVNIGLLGGSRAEIDLAQVLGKSLRIIGSRLRSRPIHEKIAITRQFRQRFWPFLVSGKLEPVIDSVFPIQEAQSAHEHVAQNRNIGKVILKVYDDSDRKTAGCPVHPPQGEDG